MIDQLEHDLRQVLTRRATEVTADAAGGEAAIAARLEAGDAGLVEVVAIGSPRRRPLRLVAAALLLVAAIGAAVFVAQGDDTVDTGPTGPGTTTASGERLAVLEFRPVLRTIAVFADGTSTPCRNVEATGDVVPERSDSGTCFEVGEALPGNALIDSVGLGFSSTGSAIGGDGSTSTTGASTYFVSLSLSEDGIDQFNALAAHCFERTATCPTGQLAVVVDDLVVSAPSVQQPEYERDMIQISGDFTEDEAAALVAALQPVDDGEPPDNSFGASATVGGELESARDVAERVAFAVFGETFVAMGATDEGLLTFVTMEGAGAAVVAEVVYDESAGGERLVRISPSADGESSGTITDGQLSFEAPEPGDLTYALLDRDLNELFASSVPGFEGGIVGALGPLVGEDEAAWLSVRLETPDGRTLVWLDSVGD